MGQDEAGTLAALKAHRQRFDAKVQAYGGRIFGGAGDSILAEFTSTVEAVQCALEVQSEVIERSKDNSHTEPMLFRIGVHLGDVMADEENLFGDGVNIAARLEALSPKGGICISGQVFEQVKANINVDFGAAGPYQLKNITRPIDVWTWPAFSAKRQKRANSTQFAKVGALVLAGVCSAAFLAWPENSRQDLPNGAHIALIPFKNASSDSEDAFFSEGLTRDVNALLAKSSNLFVIAPEAGWSFQDDHKCSEVRSQLGADFILSGSVQRTAERIRVTTTFKDAASCQSLAAPGPFDEDLTISNVLDIQLEIARKIASLVGSSDAPLFNANMQSTIRAKGPEGLGPYECVLLSYWFFQTFSKEDHHKAKRCLEEAVQDEPDYSLAWSRLAFIYLEAKKRSFDPPTDWAQKAHVAARNALAADRDNPDAYHALAVRSRMLNEDITVFREYADRAIELNPNDSWILAALGAFLAYSGDWTTGIGWIDRAKKLNPKLHIGFNYPSHLYAIARGDYQDAINIALAMPRRSPMNLASLVASFALAGDKNAAEETLTDLQTRFPDFLDDPLAPFVARGMPQELILKLRRGLTIAGVSRLE